MSRVEVPIFRAGKYPQLASMMPDSRITAADIATIARCSQRLVDEKRLVPSLKFDHTATGDAAGWLVGFRADGETLFASIEFNELGKSKLTKRERRWLSAEIVKNYSLDGTADGERLALCVNGAALLGAANPAVRGLIDLSSVEFSERSGGFSYRAFDVGKVSASQFATFAAVELSAPESAAAIAQRHSVTWSDVSNLTDAAAANRMHAAIVELSAQTGADREVCFAEIVNAIDPKTDAPQVETLTSADFADITNAEASQRIGRAIERLRHDCPTLTFEEAFNTLARRVALSGKTTV